MLLITKRVLQTHKKVLKTSFLRSIKSNKTYTKMKQDIKAEKKRWSSCLFWYERGWSREDGLCYTYEERVYPREEKTCLSIECKDAFLE